jgi:hypothetical protein
VTTLSRLDVRLHQERPGLWSGTWCGRTYEAELEPRWQRWRVAERTEHGLLDLGAVPSLEAAEALLLAELMGGRP